MKFCKMIAALALFAWSLGGSATPGSAQPWPTRTVTIVIVELPRQIRNEEEDDREHTNDPGSALVLEKMFCPAGIHRVRCIA